jgi:heme a synthase
MEQSIPLDRSLVRDSAVSARRVASWLMVLCAIVTVLILWGGIVRLSGSGLSIPDWPIINGSLLPPFSDSGWQTVYDTYAANVTRTSGAFNVGSLDLATFKTMFAIEYFHRFLAALVGIVFAVILFRAARSRDVWQRSRGFFMSALILLLAQAGLGGIVVKTDLQAAMVTAHLGTAFVFLAVLLWTALTLSREETVVAENKRLRRLAWMTLGTAYVQILFGGLMAGTGAGMILNTWPMMAGYLVPPGHLLWADWISPSILNLVQNQIFIQFVHRYMAWVVVAHVVALTIRGLRSGGLSHRAHLALRGAVSILTLQVLFGIGTLMMKSPFWMSFAHLATGLALFIVLLLITYETSNSPAAIE